jgi:octanoyl-[GcvH]:protein N-octanoyltransferase
MPSRLEVDLLTGRVADDPVLDVALATVLLEEVAAGQRRPVLRMYRPLPTLGFGRRDTFLAGFPRAATMAREHGYAPVVRGPGGRAAAYHEGCLVIEEIMPSDDALPGIEDRFAEDAERQARTLRGLGIDARVGEVPGEYCPGRFSVSAGGRTKLIGAAQRTVRGGWLIGVVVVVENAAPLRDVLERVYAALELEWNPATVGAVADEAPTHRIDDVERALLESYAQRYDLQPAAVKPDSLSAARQRTHRHSVPDGGA